MRTFLAACVLVSAAAGLAGAAENPGIGAGVVVGDPIGGTGQVFLTRTQSVDFGVGFSGDTAFWGDYAWHAWDLFPRPRRGKLEGWASAGLRLETASQTEFGVRTMVGASYWLEGHPLELFATAGPVFRMTPSGEVDADGGVGVRFYFGPGRGGGK